MTTQRSGQSGNEVLGQIGDDYSRGIVEHRVPRGVGLRGAVPAPRPDTACSNKRQHDRPKSFHAFPIIKTFSIHHSRVQPLSQGGKEETGLKFNFVPRLLFWGIGTGFKASLASWRCSIYLFWEGLFGAWAGADCCCHSLLLFRLFFFLHRTFTTTCSSSELHQPHFPFPHLNTIGPTL